jgi:hypothetical protein
MFKFLRHPCKVSMAPLLGTTGVGCCEPICVSAALCGFCSTKTSASQHTDARLSRDHRNDAPLLLRRGGCNRFAESMSDRPFPFSTLKKFVPPHVLYSLRCVCMYNPSGNVNLRVLFCVWMCLLAWPAVYEYHFGQWLAANWLWLSIPWPTKISSRACSCCPLHSPDSLRSALCFRRTDTNCPIKLGIILITCIGRERGLRRSRSLVSGSTPARGLNVCRRLPSLPVIMFFGI